MRGMKVYILRSGIITDMPREMLISTGAPVDPEDVVHLPILSYVIDHPEGLLLYDTGHSREERYFTPTEEKKRPAKNPAHIPPPTPGSVLQLHQQFHVSDEGL